MQIRVMFVNHAGGGFADTVLTNPETTLASFIASVMPGQSTGQLSIRVNNEIEQQSYVLQDGDKVTTTPTNLKVA